MDMSVIDRAVPISVGYCVCSFFVVPFDRVKTLMQASSSSQSARQTFRQVYEFQGYRGLYTGLNVQLMSMPFTILYYMLYEDSNARLTPRVGQELAPLYSAIFARTIETILRLPFELVRTQLQASPSNQYLTLGQCLRCNLRNSPVDWWRGLTPTLLRDVPFSAIYWLSYENLKRRFPQYDHIQNKTVQALAVGSTYGAVAGMTAAFITNPIDVVKTNYQKQLNQIHGREKTFQMLSRITRESGMRGLFSGLGPRLFKIPLGMSTMMASLEVTKLMLQKQRESDIRCNLVKVNKIVIQN